jgi:hypothetical protein
MMALTQGLARLLPMVAKVPLMHGGRHSAPMSRRGRAMRIWPALILVVLAPLVFFYVRAMQPSPPIQATDSKATCIYAQLGAPLREAETATGITYNCIETFSTSDPEWSDWTIPWLIRSGSEYRAWLAEDPVRHQIILTQNLIPTSVAQNPGWTAQCAAGAYNPQARKLAENLVRAGFGHSVIRLGIEMNGTWKIDKLGTTVTQWHQWGQCFAQEVQAMRQVSGSHLLFDWNVNANYRNIPLADFYPGDAYVDIIGIDAYDASGIRLPPVGDHGRWAALANEPEGLEAIAAFAAAHKKPLSIPEWGTVSTQGDDANYVTNMGNFIAKHNVAFQSWFNANDDDIFPLSHRRAPHSLDAYIKAFG